MCERDRAFKQLQVVGVACGHTSVEAVRMRERARPCLQQLQVVGVACGHTSVEAVRMRERARPCLQQLQVVGVACGHTSVEAVRMRERGCVAISTNKHAALIQRRCSLHSNSAATPVENVAG